MNAHAMTAHFKNPAAAELDELLTEAYTALVVASETEEQIEFAERFFREALARLPKLLDADLTFDEARAFLQAHPDNRSARSRAIVADMGRTEAVQRFQAAPADAAPAPASESARHLMDREYAEAIARG